MARLLMCRPTYYNIEYEINPWMSRARGAVAPVAQAQWENLYRTLTERVGAQIELVEPVPGLPDLVFTANAGLVKGTKVILSRFRFPVRSPEEPVFAAWFKAHGFEVLELPEGLFFEGAGDALRCGEHLFAGYHFRSEIRSHAAIAEMLGERVLSLQLVDPRYYHLDTCFCPLTGGKLIYYPAAFDAYARRVIEQYVPERIEVSPEDAARFGCNAVCVDNHVVLSTGCTKLTHELSGWGFQVHAVNLSEYLKSGGSAKCLTLRLD
ncbi:MAG TPA: arginine deiminase-related protein [Phycisphaerae bacterium]|jgi:N-dimethylarginine dimethylaminohydrolase|nr:amidinotransferase [Phycisphaerae bacterium]HOB73606.1 arginine deiminase-related protein [Phycisphaerae bacterium]HOL25859.1 arginine deiminase-related protein [Phycisphaerae bacterium]HPU31987.1 arginine deiminase-related protein [Phycisphaerae bacterium]HQA45708.1 arginine deiminase-related protein [Phycisphaerae bacterium]